MLKVLLLTLMLSGCTALPAINTVTDMFKEDNGIKVETELIIGDKSQELQIGHEQTATNISNIEEIPIEFIILLCLGWLLPSPGAMWKGALQLRGSPA